MDKQVIRRSKLGSEDLINNEKQVISDKKNSISSLKLEKKINENATKIFFTFFVIKTSQ
jgi:hypothetical protein